MFDIEIIYKTQKGRDEIVQRNHRLPQRLRTALVLIDGKTRWVELKARLAALGDAEQIVKQLMTLGMIESDHELPPVLVLPTAMPTANQTSKV